MAKQNKGRMYTKQGLLIVALDSLHSVYEEASVSSSCYRCRAADIILSAIIQSKITYALPDHVFPHK